jgi:ankyrin repeat protein
LAAQCGNIEVVTLLIKAGASVNLQHNVTGRTALHPAASGGHTAVVSCLVNDGIDVNVEDRVTGRTAIHLAASGGHTAVVSLLMNAGIDVNVKDETGMTAFHLAADGGQVDVVRLLIKARADVNMLNTMTGKTALYLADRRGHTDVVKLLMNAGANVLDRKTDVTLHQAAKSGFVEVVKLLANAANDVDVLDSSGMTALHLAAHGGHTKVVEVLIDAGANGMTTLHLAVRHQHIEVIKVLIDAGINVNMQGKTGMTALHLWGSSRIALQDKADTFTSLIDAGADVSMLDNTGRTALDLAVHGDHAEVLKFLVTIESGMKILSCNTSGFYQAAAYGYTELITAIKQRNGRKVSQIISEGGVSLNARYMLADWDGLSLLIIACICGRYNMVELLLESNVSMLDLQDSTGRSALMYTIRLGYLDITELLLHRGADLDLQSAKWESALSLAVSNSEMFTIVHQAVSEFDV